MSPADQYRIRAGDLAAFARAERDPNLNPKSVADLLASAAEDLGPVGRDDDFGAGRVDAYASLKLLAHDLAAKRGELAQP